VFLFLFKPKKSLISMKKDQYLSLGKQNKISNLQNVQSNLFHFKYRIYLTSNY
jgi:hypothetical protein